MRPARERPPKAALSMSRSCRRSGTAGLADLVLVGQSGVLVGNLLVVGNLVLLVDRAGQISVETMLAAPATLGHPAQSLHQGIPSSPLLGAPNFSTAAMGATKNAIDRLHP